MNHALNRIRQLHIHAPGCNAGNNAFKSLTDTLLHIFYFFQLICLALCLFCPPFHFTGLLSHLRQDRLVVLLFLFRHTTAQIVFNNAVDLQIRVTADRRCKMTVILCGQSKMPETVYGIFCLFHRSQRKAADHCLLRRTGYLCQKLLQLLWMNIITCTMYRKSKICNKRRQFFHTLCIRRLMRPIDKRQLLPEIILRHCLICYKHKIFDQIRRYIAFVRLYINRPALRI